MDAIKNAAVIGAGVMGAAIAAHLANADIPVILLDIVPESATDRNAIAKQAIERLLNSEPPAFMQRRAARLIRPGNISDDLILLKDVDWIIEAVSEQIDVKRSLYRAIEDIRKDGAIVTSNTSTLTLAQLSEGLPERFCRDFLIAHFFNPPRYVRLLELVAGPTTRPEAVATIRELADRRLGKHPILCHDTPGFIANRIGAFWLELAVIQAIEMGVNVEEADAVMSRFLSIPRTGVFGLLDLIGLDLMLQVDKSLTQSLPAHDEYCRIRRDLALLNDMVAQGLTGRKGKGGFYRVSRDQNVSVREAIDLQSGRYRPLIKPSLEDSAQPYDLRAHLDRSDWAGRYVSTVLTRLLAYAAKIAPEIAADLSTIDRALELGYNWQQGPFALTDKLGADYLARRLKRDGVELPPLLEKAAERGGFYRVKDGHTQQLDFSGRYVDLTAEIGAARLADLKLTRRPIAGDKSTSVWDIGDGVACLEIHTKMNTLDGDVLAMIRKALEIVQSDFRALVIYNEGEHFSAGANLGMLLFAANVAAWPRIDELLTQGQQTFQAIKYSPFPVVAASFGFALGGGCELLLHCDAVQAHAESYIGLVETAVGLVPGWGGCKEMLLRYRAAPDLPRGPMPAVAAAFETIGLAKMAKSAFEAKELGYLRPSDGITFNRDRLLDDAKSRALELAANYQPPKSAMLSLPGPSVKAALALMAGELRAQGRATAHDEIVATLLAEVLTGGPTADLSGPVSEDGILNLERKALLRLLRTEATLARIEHMLNTGRPLRN